MEIWSTIEYRIGESLQTPELIDFFIVFLYMQKSVITTLLNQMYDVPVSVAMMIDMGSYSGSFSDLCPTLDRVFAIWHLG